MDASLRAALDATPAWGADESDALLADLLDDTDALLAELLPLEPPISETVGDELLLQEDDTPKPPTTVAGANVSDVLVLPPPPPSQPPAKARPETKSAAFKAPKAITRTAKEKLKLSELRTEANQLTRELKRLRARNPSLVSVSSAMEIATNERRKRRRAEDECRQLRTAVYQHARFLRNLRSVFSFPPPLSQGLNLSQYLHDYVRLPRDRSTRRTEYEALSRDERLAMAVEILCRETEAISFDEPHIHTELLPSSDGFAVTTLSVYAVDTIDLSAVLRGACVAVRDIVTRWPQCEPVDVTRKIVDADEAVVADHHLMYRLVTAKHKHRETGAELSVQARATTFYKLTDGEAVMMWDFVDEDELYPVATEPTDVTRKSIGALMMRKERCRDGNERVVCRSICTKRYTANSSCRPGVLDRFVHAAKESLRPNGRVFYEIVTQQVAEEEALVSRHLTTQSAAVC